MMSPNSTVVPLAIYAPAEDVLSPLRLLIAVANSVVEGKSVCCIALSPPAGSVTTSWLLDGD